MMLNISRNYNKKQPMLKYPENLSDIVPSYLQIALKTTPPGYQKQTFKDPVEFGKKGDIYSIINLPIPNGLLDNTDAVWSNEVTANILQSITNNMLDSANLASQVIKSQSGIHGEAHIIHTFSNINAKVYNLTWIFLPQSSSEGQEVEKIIKTLKRAQLPSVGSTAMNENIRNMMWPDFVDLKIIGNAGRYQKFLPCFINSVYVDRNFDDTFLEYTDGISPLISLNISLVEISNYTKEIFDEVYK